MAKKPRPQFYEIEAIIELHPQHQTFRVWNIRWATRENWMAIRNDLSAQHSSSRAATTRTIYFWGQAHIHTVGVRPLLHAAELVLTVTGVHIKWATMSTTSIQLMWHQLYEKTGYVGFKMKSKTIAKNVQLEKLTKAKFCLLPFNIRVNSQQHIGHKTIWVLSVCRVKECFGLFHELF